MGTALSRRSLTLALVTAALGTTGLFAACTDSYQGPSGSGGSTSSSSSAATTGSGGTSISLDGGGGSCDTTCSNDLKSVVDCKGTVLTACTADQGCANGACINDPCQAAEDSKSSYGCDYWALKTALRPQADGACFAAFVANTWGKPVHISVEFGGLALPTETFAYIPEGQGTSITYKPYDAAAGLDVGQVAVLFLSRKTAGASVVNCPMPAAVNGETGVPGTGVGKGFHITTDVPVVAYQMVPYGGGQAAVTSATLLLPTSAWDTNYVAVNAYKSAEPDGITGGNPSLDIIAYKDNTKVTILPKVDIVAGTNVSAATANTQAEYTLNKGEFLQITQPAELTGSPIQSDQPIGVFGAATCMDVPVGTSDCDSAQQQIPPVRALGNEYVGVRYRGRMGGAETSVPWRLVGAVNGTNLTWEPSTPPGAPKSIGLGDVIEFLSPGPFVVKSQDTEHPFYIGGYMTGGQPFNGEGDPDWVNVIPPQQYLNHYVLFTDPTYPETNLVLVRTPSKVDGSFAEVMLSCAGGTMAKAVDGWTKIGNYEYTRVDLVTGNFTSVDGCSNGRQEIQSSLPFGVTVWGWGATQQTQYVSYAYPAGAGFQPINTVVVPPIPK
ncbi:MAG: IgGFc-binding protein [Minicystis sp.]